MPTSLACGEPFLLVDVDGFQKEQNVGKTMNMGVSKNRGTPKWMVYKGKPYLNWMIWGYHNFGKHPYLLTLEVLGHHFSIG